MKHIVLLGDSIFDNADYVDAGDSVLDCLQGILPSDYKATLLAVDGDITDDVYSQLDKLPSDVTYAFLTKTDTIKNLFQQFLTKLINLLFVLFMILFQILSNGH